MPEHTLYMNAASAPCRAVLLHLHLVGDAFGPVDYVPVDLSAREYPADLLRSNPLHTVPTLVTPWGAIWESRAIMRYIESMLPEPRHYPVGVYAHAVVDRLLDWDLGTLYRSVSGIVYPWIFGGGIQPSALELDKLFNALRFLDQAQLGDGRPFLCGPDLSIADISIAMTLSMLRLVDIDVDDFLNVLVWKNRMAEIDGHAAIDLPFQQWVDDVHATAPQRAPELDTQAFLGTESSDAPDGAIHESLHLSALDRARLELDSYGGAVEGERNMWTHRVACIGYDHGVDSLTWLDEMHAWNERHNTPPLSREEVESIVHAAYKRERKQHAAGGSAPPPEPTVESAPPS